MPHQRHRARPEAVDEVAEQRHHIVVAGQPVCCRQAHPRQVRVDPPVPRARDDGLDRRLDLTMIHAGAVQGDNRHTTAVLDPMDHGFVDPALHGNTLTIHGVLTDPRRPHGSRGNRGVERSASR